MRSSRWSMLILQRVYYYGARHMASNQRRLSIIVLLSVFGVATLSMAWWPRAKVDDTVYTPSTFLRSIALQNIPVGRTVLMRGVLVQHNYTRQSLEPAIYIQDAVEIQQGPTSTYAEIDVVLGPQNPIIEVFRHVPALGQLVPATADHPITGQPATYRLRLVRCMPPSCALSPLPTVWQIQDGGRN